MKKTGCGSIESTALGAQLVLAFLQGESESDLLQHRWISDADKTSRLCMLKAIRQQQAVTLALMGWSNPDILTMALMGWSDAGVHMLCGLCQDKKEKKDRKRRRGAAAVDEGWEEVSPEEMQAAAELLAEEMTTIKAAMDVQASVCPPLPAAS